MSRRTVSWVGFGILGVAALFLSGCLFGGGCPPLPPLLSVYSFGSNAGGKLGHGDYDNRATPTKIPGLEGVAAVATGYLHALVVLANGDVYAFGWNWYGQLGLGDGAVEEPTPEPTKIPGLPGPAAGAAAAHFHSLVLLRNGDVYSFGNRWGNSRFGDPLGHGDALPRFAPTRIEGLPGPAAAVAAGGTPAGGFSLVLLADGDVYSFGFSGTGALGHADGMNRFTPERIAGLPGPAVAVAAGSQHSLVLLANGDVYSFGDNDGGQLGHGDTSARHTPTKIAGLPGPAVAVAAGGYHSLVVLANGDVYSFGNNAWGQLGHGDTTNRHVPTKIEGIPGSVVAAAGSEAHTLVLLANGDVYSFGANGAGALGHGDYTQRLTPAKIGTVTGAKGVAASGIVPGWPLGHAGSSYVIAP